MVPPESNSENTSTSPCAMPVREFPRRTVGIWNLNLQTINKLKVSSNPYQKETGLQGAGRFLVS
jgi:hypothetical protein